MMSPAGGRHGRVAFSLGLILGNHVRQHQLGVVYASETGFLISRDPDTVRAPDVAFVDQTRAQQFDADIGYVPLAPDFVAVVISPSDTFSDVEEKVRDWLDAGTGLVLLVDPSTRMVHAYRDATNIVIMDDTMQCDASDVIKGWRFAIGDLFV